MYCGGGHLEFSIGIKKQKLCRGPSNDHPGQFGFNHPSGFRGEDFLEINQSETRIACDGHVC